MAEDIYENADFLNTTTPSSSTAGNICMAEVPKGSQQRTENGEPEDKLHGGHDRRYRLAVVLVCVLLLAVTIGLCITGLKTKELHLRYKNLAEEKDQLQLQYNNITAEKAQLETKFSAERDELHRRLCDRESHDMKNIKQHAVDVILDPDTAHPNLILSADGKQVKHGDTRQNLPDTPNRFTKYSIVLGREGFSSGKFYYEVQVKGKAEWRIGVAKESINRKGEIFLSPKYGLWTISLQRDGTYTANSDPPVPLSLKGNLQMVGVFVDYDTGLVSFYDADCWDHIYSFINVSFTVKIYPYFNPNEGSKNSAPFIISPVHVCPI